MSAHQVIHDWDTNVVFIMMGVNVAVSAWRIIRRRDTSDEQRFHLYAAALWLAVGIMNFLNRYWLDTLLCALWMALDLRRWWKGGGGNNTKRRLKKLKEKFVGKRRTAPVTA